MKKNDTFTYFPIPAALLTEVSTILDDITKTMFYCYQMGFFIVCVTERQSLKFPATIVGLALTIIQWCINDKIVRF